LASASDADLVAACARGAPEAFRELLARYRKSALSLAYQMMGNGEDAEDVAQEAFVRVFQAMPQFRGEAAFPTWLYRIVTNLCIGNLRRRCPDVNLDAVGEPSAPESPSRHVADGLLTTQVLNMMSPELKAILLLRVQGQLSYHEISQTLGIPVGTVRSRLSKARGAFRELWTRLSRTSPSPGGEHPAGQSAGLGGQGSQPEPPPHREETR
jgi:RNA polymerase sigma-70 factor (ECF subfamily)